jgi:hypothetical protein
VVEPTYVLSIGGCEHLVEDGGEGVVGEEEESYEALEARQPRRRLRHM